VDRAEEKVGSQGHQAAGNIGQSDAYRNDDCKLLELLDAQRSYRDRLGHVIEVQSFYWRSLNKLNAAVGLNAYDPEKFSTEPVAKDAEKK
jgi:hypothetical protein